MSFAQTIKKYIRANRLLADGGVYVVALSGGPDSVALLRVLVSLGYTVHAAHCNFHLRGDESNRDEAFCVSLCKRLAIPLHVVHFDTVAYAGLHKISIEMAARNLRYHWFAGLCGDISADGICVAHHQDDQVETVLLNMLRGTGLRGLLGMMPKTELPIGATSCAVIRPLLCVDEGQVMDYLSALGQDYVVDSSNLHDDVKRNKLRLDIIPLLEQVTPSAKQNIIRMTENLGDINAIAEESLKVAMANASVKLSLSGRWTNDVEGLVLAAYDMSKVNAFVAPVTLLWTMLSPYGFNRSQVVEIANSKGDNREWRSDHCVALLGRTQLIVADRRKWEMPLPVLVIPEPGLYCYGGRHVRVRRVDADFSISKSSDKATLDAANVHFPLTFRPASPGDRFAPFGMNGGKLVGDYLKDRKRGVVGRHLQRVLTDADNKILWLVGECIDNSCRIQPQTTKRVVEVAIE